MSETAEQVKHTPSLEEARRILASPNRAYELLNLIGVRDKLLEACNDVIQHWGAGLKHLEVGENNRLLVKMCEAANKAEGRR